MCPKRADEWDVISINIEELNGHGFSGRTVPMPSK